MLRNSTTQTKKLTKGLDYTNRLRSAFNVIRNDVSHGLNYRDLNLFLYNQAQKERAEQYEKDKADYIAKFNKDNPQTPIADGNLSPEQQTTMDQKIGKKPPPFKPKEEVVVTHFVGEKDKLYFTSSSGLRFRSADKVSNLIEVGYFFRTCKSRTDSKSESKCLWRSVSYNLDEDVTKGGKESVLLEHIEEFEFQYLSFRDSEKPDWIKSWDSRESGDVRTGDSFPAAVSLSVKTKVPLDKGDKKFREEKFSGVFDIYFANNKPFEGLKKAAQTADETTKSVNPGQPKTPATN